MSLLRDVRTIFESEPEGILWLPPITMAYLYTITGIGWHLGLAILAVAGARMMGDILESELVEETDEGHRTLREDIVGVMASGFSGIQAIGLAIIAVAYLGSAVYGAVLIYQHFDHTDLILVGLTVVWGGTATIVVANSLGVRTRGPEE